MKRLVFSSSSTVFGDPEYLPIDENHPTGNCTNPYGRTKYIVEEFIKDVCRSDQVRLKTGTGTALSLLLKAECAHKHTLIHISQVYCEKDKH